jgi:GxxExxY protein
LRVEAVATTLVDSCVAVHRELGPGLLESAYQACLAYELRSRGIKVDTELSLPINCRGTAIDVGYRIDMLVDGQVVVENKSVQALLPVHEAQLLTYLKVSNYKLGFLINWNVPLIKDGQSGSSTSCDLCAFASSR